MDNELVKLLKLAQGDRSLNAFARHADISPGNLSRIMNGQKATPQTLEKIANKAHNNVTYEQLMIAAGYITSDNEKSKSVDKIKESADRYVITKKDEKDISKDVEKIMSKLDGKEAGPTYYNGKEMNEEDKDLFKAALELALKTIKIKNKETYTPKKYKK